MMDHAISTFSVVSIPNPVHDPTWKGLSYRPQRYSCALLLLLLIAAAVVRRRLAGRRALARMLRTQ